MITGPYVHINQNKKEFNKHITMVNLYYGKGKSLILLMIILLAKTTKYKNTNKIKLNSKLMIV